MNDNKNKIIRTALSGLGLAWCVGAAAIELPPLDCVIEPYEIIEVSSAAEGVIEHVHVERNDLIARGQVIAELESDVEKASLAYAQFNASLVSEIKLRRTSLEFDERNHDRLQELFTKKAIPLHHKDEAETDAAKSQWLLTKAEDDKRLAALEYARATAVLKRKTVRSPISGVVVARHKSTGEYIEDQAIVTVAQLHPLRVEVIVPVELFGTIENGTLAEIIPELDTTGPLRATVTSVDRVVDGASGTFDVRLELPNPDYAIPSGLKCEIAFSGDSGGGIEPTGPLEEVDRLPAAEPVEAIPAFPAPDQSLREAAVAPTEDDIDVDELIGEPETADVSVAADPQTVSTELIEVPDPVADAAPDMATTTSPTEPGMPVQSGAAEPTIPTVEQVETTLPVTVANSAEPESLCRVLGPLSDPAEIDRVSAALSAVAATVTPVVRTETVVHSYILATPTADDPDTRGAIAARIAEKGLEDTALLYKGSLRNRYSFGVYNNKTVASIKRRAIEKQGFEVELLPRSRDEERTWIEVVAADPGLSAEDLLFAGNDAGVDAELIAEPCVDAVRQPDHDGASVAAVGSK